MHHAACGHEQTAVAYRDGRGRLVDLGRELGGGGEGKVFALRDRPDLCAKVYRSDRAAARAEKIALMIRRRPPWLLRRALAWPIEPLYAGDAFAGFVMPLQHGMIELFRLVVPDERMAAAGWLTPADLHLIAARLAGVIAGVHRRGHVIGDLKPQNILVSPRDLRVALIDTDSFQIRDPKTSTVHRSAVVTPEYAAPEVCRADLARTDRAPASDLFALAVLVHQLLLGGAHPHDGELAPGLGAGSVERVPGRIRRGLCPLVPGVTAVRPAAGALPTGSLPEALRALLVRAFGPGHADPEARPSAVEWRAALLEARRALVRCSRSRAHCHAPGLSVCPYCERRDRSGIDLFPAGLGWQCGLAKVGDPAAAPEPERRRWLDLHVRARLSGGRVTAAERAFLEKVGAGLGFDRAGVGRAIEQAAARAAERRRGWPDRRSVVLSAASLAVGGAAAAGVLTSARAVSGGDGARREACVALVQEATIGNTRGRGAFLRKEPSLLAEKLPLPEGTKVRPTGRTRTAEELGWSEVEVPLHGRAGWVATRYLVEGR